MLVEICKAYIDAINKGALPNIENAWTYVCRNETNKAIEEAVVFLENNLNSLS